MVMYDLLEFVSFLALEASQPFPIVTLLAMLLLLDDSLVLHFFVILVDDGLDNANEDETNRNKIHS